MSNVIPPFDSYSFPSSVFTMNQEIFKCFVKLGGRDFFFFLSRKSLLKVIETQDSGSVTATVASTSTSDTSVLDKVRGETKLIS